jgi:DNA-binding SARP family transcriptional activator
MAAEPVAAPVAGRAAADQPPPLRVCTLGATEVRREGVALEGPWLDHRTGELFRFLLAERRRVVKVDEIGESIWPVANYAVAGSVRYYVHVLRRELEPERAWRSPSMFIACRAGGYMLNRAVVWVDADEFERSIADGLGRGTDDPVAAADVIESALSLYRGDFLADEPYAVWAIPERQRLHELACTGLAVLAELRLAQGSEQRALAALSRLAGMQPYDEDVHRRLIELDLQAGRRSDALRRYAALRSRLRRVFGEEPSFTPADLARTLRRVVEV